MVCANGAAAEGPGILGAPDGNLGAPRNEGENVRYKVKMIKKITTYFESQLCWQQVEENMSDEQKNVIIAYFVWEQVALTASCRKIRDEQKLQKKGVMSKNGHHHLFCFESKCCADMLQKNERWANVAEKWAMTKRKSHHRLFCFEGNYCADSKLQKNERWAKKSSPILRASCRAP